MYELMQIKLETELVSLTCSVKLTTLVGPSYVIWAG